MSVRVNVQGGTGAGRRKPPAERPGRWRCGCEALAEGCPLLLERKLNPGYLVRCPDCGSERPGR